MIKTKVDGTKTIAAIDKLIKGLDSAVLQGAVDVAYAGQKEARANSKGSLRRNVVVQRQNKQVKLAAKAPYSRFVEHGRGPIAAKGKALRFEVGGKVLYRKSVGPAKARPFMAPARAVMNESSLVEVSINELIRSL